MSLHINRFIDNLKVHESRNSRDFVMTMRDAKDLHADITKLLLALQTLQEPRQDQPRTEPEKLELEITGGSFKNG